MRLLTGLLLLLCLAAPVIAGAAENLPYTGQVSDRSLAATDSARSVLLADRATMKGWTVQQWQSWADKRFTKETSSDGTTWRDWQRAQIKRKSDSVPLQTILSRPALLWDADDWGTFVDHIDYDYQSSSMYFCVISSGTQYRGTTLLGRWAYSMYNDGLPERLKWEAKNNGSTEDEMLQMLVQMGQAQLEMLCFLAGLLTASIVSSTWKW